MSFFSPRPERPCAERGFLGLWVLHQGKETARVNIQLSRIARHHLGLPSLGPVGESVGLNNQASDKTSYEGRAYGS